MKTEQVWASLLVAVALLLVLPLIWRRWWQPCPAACGAADATTGRRRRSCVAPSVAPPAGDAGGVTEGRVAEGQKRSGQVGWWTKDIACILLIIRHAVTYSIIQYNNYLYMLFLNLRLWSASIYLCKCSENNTLSYRNTKNRELGTDTLGATGKASSKTCCIDIDRVVVHNVRAPAKLTNCEPRYNACRNHTPS